MRIALIQQMAHHDKVRIVERGLQALTKAAADGAQMVCFAELALEPFYPQRRAGEVATLRPTDARPHYRGLRRQGPGAGRCRGSQLFERDGTGASTARR